MADAALGDPSPMHWLTRLEPTPQGRSYTPASSPGLIASAVDIVGAAPVQWAVEVGHGMATRIVREMPGFGRGAEAFDVLRMGTESTTIQSLLLLAGVELKSPASAEALDGVTDFVRRGIGLDLVLRGIRLGHAGMSEAFLVACERLVAPEKRLELAKRLSASLFDFIDAFAATMAEKFLQEQVRWSTSDVAAKLELVNSMLRGAGPDQEMASRRLGLDLSETHVGLVVWSSALNLDVDAIELQDAAVSILRRMRSVRRLIIPIGSGVVWAWGRVDRAEEAISAIEETALSDRIHVGVGVPASGMDGFCRSHREAQAAAELAQSGQTPRPVTFYGRVDLVSLLLSDRGRAVEFMRRELGALAAGTSQVAELRDTLLVFLEEESSPNAAARRLNVARNTITYRIRRVEEILGRPVDVRRVQLQAALLIANVVGVSERGEGKLAASPSPLCAEPRSAG